jgi:CHAT domain-containing protein/tetratricopeptide (TPR) repeat protein
MRHFELHPNILQPSIHQQMKNLLFLMLLCSFFQANIHAQVNGPYTIADTVIAKQIYQNAKALYTAGKLDSALLSGYKVNEIFSAVLDSNHIYLAGSNAFVGVNLSMKGKEKESLYYFERAIKIYEKYPESAAYIIAISNLGAAYMKLLRNEDAYTWFSKALVVCAKILPENSLVAANAYHNMGAYYNEVGKPNESIPFYKKALNIRIKTSAPNDPNLATTFINIGNHFSTIDEIDSSIVYYEQALKIFQKLKESKHQLAGPLGGTLYHNLGNLYNKKNNYNRAIQCLELAVQLREEALGHYHLKTGMSYLDIANIYSQIGERDKALEYCLIALDIQHNKSGSPGLALARIYKVYGDIMLSYDKYDQSLTHYNQALSIYTQNKEQNAANYASLYNSIGFAYDKLHDLNASLDAAKKSLEAYLSMSDPGHKNLIREYINLAKGYLPMDSLDKATYYLDQAQSIIEKFDKNSYKVITLHGLRAEILRKKQAYQAAQDMLDQAISFGITEVDNPAFQKELIVVIENKFDINHILYSKTKDVKYLYDSRAHIALYNRILDKQLQQLSVGDSKERLINFARPGLESIISTSCRLNAGTDSIYYLNDVFKYIEKTKYIQLYEGAQSAYALHFSGIPDSLLAQEYDLRVDIAYHEQRKFDLQGGEIATDTNLLAINKRLFELHQQYESLQKNFETNYPDYYRLKYNHRTEDVASVQRDLLEPDQALVEYFVGDSAVFVFTILKNDYSVLEIKKDFPLNDWVTQLRRGLTGFFTDPNLADQYEQLSGAYTEAAYNIYQKLVAPIAAKLPKKVVFVADGILGYVPFEALLAEKPSDPTRWAQHHYLQNDHTVSYCYSGTMLREMLQHKHKTPPTLPFLGFAPQYDGDTSILASTFKYVDDMRKDLKPLPYSGEEVYRAAKIMGGQVLVGAEATETAFVERAGQARVLHLATHGQANDRLGDYCFLVFGGGEKDAKEQPLLYARDIYNLQLNADLVTLSACETGIGELKDGEGIISLARAFAYAGAKSIVTSLWSVSDAKTKDLMLGFYKNIHKKAPKDEALRQAKLEFLKRNKGLAAHPFYWAGFVGIGDMGALK